MTGGSGFIGSSFIRYCLEQGASCERVCNLDLLTYAADIRNLKEVELDSRYRFIQGDICNETLVETLCVEEEIDAIVHFAAESHVDRSIATPQAFYHTNVGGTLALLEVVRRHPKIHFHHISTDEVFGSLADEGFFSENSLYRPNSPYSASKAASDHFVRAYAHTYGLSTTTSHCTNNYGPCQHIEKFIPRMIANLIAEQPLPVYGEGKNIRDWIYVKDHSAAVWTILQNAVSGETFGIGGECEMRNIDLLERLIDYFAEAQEVEVGRLRSLITFVPDRPGHDLRYGMDCRKIQSQLGWRPTHDLSIGLRSTIAWYLKHFEDLAIYDRQ